MRVHYFRGFDPEQKTNIDLAMDIIPERFRSKLQSVDIICGASSYDTRMTDVDYLPDGRLLKHWAHTSWSMAKDGSSRVNIFLPKRVSPIVVAHELGHALHAATGFRETPDIRPVTEYAKTSRYELYAEAFVSWLGFDLGDRRVGDVDPETAAFFAGLADES